MFRDLPNAAEKRALVGKWVEHGAGWTRWPQGQNLPELSASTLLPESWRAGTGVLLSAVSPSCASGRVQFPEGSESILAQPIWL